MKDIKNESIKNLPFSELIGKRILLLTHDKIVYHAKVLDVSENFVKFSDKFGKIVSLAISSIKQITEMENGKY